MRNSRPVLMLLFFASWSRIAIAQLDVDKLAAEADPAIQAKINDAFDSQSELEFFQQVQALNEMADDKGELVRQLTIFAAISPEKQEFHELIVLRILHQLQLASSIPIRVLAPYLDSENERLRDFAREWFQGHSKAAFEDPFKDYGSYAGNALSWNEGIPIGFVEYLFEVSPDRALQVFLHASRMPEVSHRLKEMSKKHQSALKDEKVMRYRLPPQIGERSKNSSDLRDRLKKLETSLKKREAREVPDKRNRVEIPPLKDDQQIRDVKLANHIVNNAIWFHKNGFKEQFQQALPEATNQLHRLAEYDQWWVRLYVSEIMRRHRELRQEDILESLSNDSNALVGKSARSLKR